jgi:glycosyltransferase involved in cell wall biosynthesis
MQSLGVVIPMLDEEAGAARCVDAVAPVVEKLGREARLIVVDDGSSDRTGEVLAQLARERELLEVETHERNRGYGAALRTGVEAARRLGLDWALFMDSDLTNPPGDITRFAALIDGPVDYVKASRFEPGGSMRGVPARRRALSVAANRISRLAAGRGISDPTNGFRAIRTEAFLRMQLTEPGFAVIMEELVWALRLGLRCASVPSVLTARDESLRPTSFGYRPSLLLRYGRYTLRLAADRLRHGSR